MSLRTGRGGSQQHLPPLEMLLATILPAEGRVGLGAAVQLGTVHLGRMGGLLLGWGGRVCAAEEALPHGVLGQRLGPTLLNQALHDLVLRVHGAKDSPAGGLAVGGLGPVTAVQTWYRRRWRQSPPQHGARGDGGGPLTVQGAAYGVGLREVADTVEQLSAVTLTVLCDGVDLGHGGGGVGPEDGLAVLSAGRMTPRIAAAGGAH